MQVFGDVLPQAVAVAISPIPVALVILVLVSRRARTSGPGFAVGWVAALAVVTGAAAAAAGAVGASEDGAAAVWADLLELVLGLVLAVLAVRQWRGRPRPGEVPPEPKLFQAVDSLTPPRAAGLGALAAGVNPKNLVLSLSAGFTMAQSGLSTASAAATVAAFTFVASLTVLTPVVAVFVLGDRARPALDATKQWLVANNSTILVVLFAVLAAKLLGDGLSAFA